MSIKKKKEKIRGKKGRDSKEKKKGPKNDLPTPV
jgi:hypothetical protein